MAEPVKVLGLPPHTYLTAGQSQRMTCLALVLTLVQGRSVHITHVRDIAEWVYGGNGSKP